MAPARVQPMTASQLSALSLEAWPASEWPALEPVWSELARESPYGSFFLTAEWTGVWLAVWGRHLNPQILVFRADGVPVAICLLVQKTEYRGPFAIRRIYLNTSGEDAAESAYIEFNNLLCRAGWEQPVGAALAAHIAALPWDEVALNGFCDGVPLEALMRGLDGTRRVVQALSSPYVDLRELRENGWEFVESLGSTTRKHLRQNLRHYVKRGGKLTTVGAPPGGQDVAGEIFDELIRLHQRAWTNRGEPGVFSAPRFVEFHRELIRSLLPLGYVQLLRVSAGEETVGVVYNFVYRGKVCFYQSGFNYADDKRLSPGTVTLACAIEHCVQEGWNEYDFLAGESQYKKVLATKSRQLHWIVLQRPTLKLRGLQALKSLRNVWRRLGGRLAPQHRRQSG